MYDKLPDNVKNIFAKLAESGRAVGDRPLIIGGFVRDWLYGLPIDEIFDFDVITENGNIDGIINDFVTRFGLGQPVEYEYTGTKTIFLDGHKIEFQSPINENVHFPIEDELIRMGIEVNFLNKNIYERDFTINTICLDVIDKKILDVTGYGVDDLLKNRILRTPIDAKKAVEFNPLIVLRGFRFMLEFDLKPESSYARVIPYGVKLLSRVTEERSDRFIKSIVRDIFSYDEDRADEIFRHYGLYDIIPIPSDIMERKVKNDMGIKYLASYDIIHKIAGDKVILALDFDDLYNKEVQRNIKKLASKLFINDQIKINTPFIISGQQNMLFSIENIKEAFDVLQKNKLTTFAQTGNFLYDRYKRRKEYRDRKRREKKRDRINKLKMWRNFQHSFMR